MDVMGNMDFADEIKAPFQNLYHLSITSFHDVFMKFPRLIPNFPNVKSFRLTDSCCPKSPITLSRIPFGILPQLERLWIQVQYSVAERILLQAPNLHTLVGSFIGTNTNAAPLHLRHLLIENLLVELRLQDPIEVDIDMPKLKRLIIVTRDQSNQVTRLHLTERSKQNLQFLLYRSHAQTNVRFHPGNSPFPQFRILAKQIREERKMFPKLERVVHTLYRDDELVGREELLLYESGPVWKQPWRSLSLRIEWTPEVILSSALYLVIFSSVMYICARRF